MPSKRMPDIGARVPASILRCGLLAALFAVGGTLASPVWAACAGSNVLTVALDRDSYRIRELGQLEAEVSSAAQSRTQDISIGEKDGAVVVTIADRAQSRHFLDLVAAHIANDPHNKVAEIPAEHFSISYSAKAKTAYSEDQIAHDSAALDSLVESLRTPLPGVVIERTDDGAIVRADDPAFQERMKKALHELFVIAPLTSTSWRVSLAPSLLAGVLGPARALRARRVTDQMLQQLLSDPLDLDVEKTDDGVSFAVSNPESHPGFIENVRNAFRNNPDFVIASTNALVLRITPADTTPQPAVDDGLPPAPVFDLMGRVDELANPATDVSVEGDAVVLRARDASRNAEVAAIAREVLAARSDLTISTRPDQSLSIALAPGAHIATPLPALKPGELEQAVVARLKALNLQACMAPVTGAQRVEVGFANASDAAGFRTAIANPPGLTIRMVDETAAGQNPDAPPSPGDQKYRLDKEQIWVKPDIIVSANMIDAAAAGTNSVTGEAEITYHFTDEGRERFEAFTRANVMKRFAVIVDGTALMAPVVREPIIGPSGVIAGNFTLDRAKEYVALMLSHKDELPLKIVDDAAGQ